LRWARGTAVKGAALIVEAVDAGDFPVRLFLGSDTIARVSSKIGFVGAEIERQRDNVASADHAA
jgi:hypothetical protein